MVNRTGCRSFNYQPSTISHQPTNKLMKKQITLGIITLALIVGGILTRVWAIDWPQSAFRQAQTAFNPVETILEPLPSLYWWSRDVDVTSLASRRGRAWSPVVMDFATQQGVPDPIIAE